MIMAALTGPVMYPSSWGTSAIVEGPGDKLGVYSNVGKVAGFSSVAQTPTH